MAIVLIDTSHFSGGANIAPTPDSSVRDLAKLIREAQTAVNDLESGAVEVPDTVAERSFQAVAGDATELIALAQAAGEITAVKAVAGTGADGASDLEKMDIEVKINGTTCLSAPITLDEPAGTTVQSGTVTAGTLAADDKITVERDHTLDGGGGDTLADTTVIVFIKKD